MDSYFGQKHQFRVKTPCMQLFTSQDIYLSRVDYVWIIVMFLSAVQTLILMAPIHSRWSIGEQMM